MNTQFSFTPPPTQNIGEAPPANAEPQGRGRKKKMVIAVIAVVILGALGGYSWYRYNATTEPAVTPPQATSVYEAEAQAKLKNACVKNDQSANGGKYVAFEGC